MTLQRALATVGNSVGQAFGYAGSFVLTAGRGALQRLALVPPFLGHSLWLINTHFRDLANEAYGGNGAVYACLQLLTMAVAEPPLIAYVRQPNGEPHDPLPYDHPLRLLIEDPNPFMTQFQLWEMATLHLGIVGRSLFWKERSNSNEIIGLWPLRPDRCGPIYAKPGDDNPVLIGWSYQVPDSQTFIGIPREDVLTFIIPDPMGQSGGLVEGRGPLQALVSEVSADNEASKFVGALVSNYAAPGTVVKVKGKITSRDDAQLIKQAYMQDFGGAKRGEPAVIDSDSDVTHFGFSLQQLEFSALRRVSESRIASAFHVPAIMVGLLVGLESGIRATLGEMREFFTETTCASYWRRYSDQFTKQVAAEFGPHIVCKFDTGKVKALNAQTLATADRVERAFLRGALLVNEYRAALGFPELPDGNTRLLPARTTEMPEQALVGQVADDVEREEDEISPLN